jgi:hypothetical protein
MATVRFSNELKENILERAKAPFDKRNIEIKKIPVEEGLFDLIYKRALGDWFAPVQNLPDGFMEVYQQFTLTRVVVPNHPDISLHYTFQLPQPVRWVQNYTGISNRAVQDGWGSTNFKYIADLNNEDDARIHNVFLHMNDLLRQNQERKEKFVNGVSILMETHTTLAPALKAWPALWDLLPQSTKDKHLEVKEKSAAQEKKAVIEQLDLASMTATVVVNKMVR